MVRGLSKRVADQDRLQQLREQKTAIAKHLAWLDQEIAREDDSEPPASPRLKLARKASTEDSEPQGPIRWESDNPSPGVHADPEVVLEEWTETQPSEPSSGISKSGCWLIFAALALLGIASVVLIVLTQY